MNSKIVPRPQLAHLIAQLDELKQKGTYFHLRILEDQQEPVCTYDGKRVINLASNNYLGLTAHPKLREAAIEATRKYGVGSGAVRTIAGTMRIHMELEEKIARFKNVEACVVFQSGFTANAGTVSSILGKDDFIISDELNHASVIDGARLSRAKVKVFRHRDTAHAEELLQEVQSEPGRKLLITDGVFSMDGDLAPVGEMLALAKAHDAWLMTDDAHGIGVINEGRGSAHGHDVPLQMGTLSKAVGSYGGYLCASHVVCELIRNRARSFVYTTGLPPAVVGASIAALDLIATDPAMCAAPLAHARRFCAALGLPPAESPIVPLLLGTAERALAAQAVLEAAGFLVAAIRPPTVPEGTARLRFAFTACHAPDDIDRLAQLVHDRILVTA